MIELLTILSWTVFAGYVVSLRYYFIYFKSKTEELGKRTRVWLGVTVGGHTVYLLLLSIRLNHLPVGDTFSVLTSCAWFFVVVYLILERKLKEMTMGVFFVPIILLLQSTSNLFINFDKPLSPVLTELFFEVHVAFMICSYAAFTISFITSVMYILLSREMQSKQFGIFFERLPSLEFFDNLSNQAVNIGLILVTVGFGMGLYMGVNVWEGGWAWDPKMIAVVLSWAIYFAHFITRKSIGWQGRRAAIVSVIGFNWLLFSFIIVSNFFSTIHNFQ